MRTTAKLAELPSMPHIMIIARAYPSNLCHRPSVRPSVAVYLVTFARRNISADIKSRACAYAAAHAEIQRVRYYMPNKLRVGAEGEGRGKGKSSRYPS